MSQPDTPQDQTTKRTTSAEIRKRKADAATSTEAQEPTEPTPEAENEPPVKNLQQQVEESAGEKLRAQEEKEAREMAARVVGAGTAGAVPSKPDDDQSGSMSPIILEDESVQRLVTSFADLFTFPIGINGHVIEVERIEPTTHEGVPTRGILQPITKPISFNQFVRFYGGRKYKLAVFGPSPRTEKFVRRTKPIEVNVPGDVPPTTDADRSRMGQANNADARMFETQMEYLAKQQERQEQQAEKSEAREMSREDKARREERGHADLAVSVLQNQLKQAQSAVDRMQDKLDREREEREKEREKDDKKPDMSAMMAAQIDAQAKVTAAALTAATAKPQSDPRELQALQDLQNKLSEQHKDEIKTLTAQHAAEVKAVQELQNKLTEQHREEIKTQTAQQIAELTRLREEQAKELRRVDEQLASERMRADERIKQNEERATERLKSVEVQAAERIKVVEAQAAERMKAIEERASRDLVSAKEDITQAKADGDRRVSDLKDRYEDRVKDLDRGHKREVDGSKERWELQVSNETRAFQTQLAIKDQEIQRLQSELEDARDEAKKPLTDRINEVAAAAEALGYGKNEPEQKDWKQMALEVGGNLVANLPELLRSAGDTVGKLRQQPTPQQMAAYTQAQQAQMQVGAGARAQQLAAGPRGRAAPYGARPRGGFATEDGPTFEGPHSAPTPIFPGQPPVPATQPQPAPSAAAQPMAVPVMPAQPSQPMAAPVAAVVPVATSAPVNDAEPAAEASAEPSSISDAQVLEFRPLFEAALKQGAAPSELAQHLIRTYGKPNVAVILTMMNPERVVGALQNNGLASSPLCRRDGQKYLRETFGTLQKLCA